MARSKSGVDFCAELVEDCCIGEVQQLSMIFVERYGTRPLALLGNPWRRHRRV